MATHKNIRFDIIIVVIVGSIIFVYPILATEHVVGDDIGWTPNFGFYQAWAISRQFYVGDTLVFRYPQRAHNVVSVNQIEYENCVAPKNVVPLNSGNDTILLSLAGERWYICGLPGQCINFNMRLPVNVLPITGSPTGPPAHIVSYPNSRAPKIGSSASMYSNFGVMAIVSIGGLLILSN